MLKTRLSTETRMTISSWETVESTSPLRRNDSAAPSRPQRRHPSNGRPVEPILAKRTQSKRAPAQITLVVRRAHSDFWCEGHLGDWDGHCGYCVLAGEGYVQSGERRL